MGEDTPARTLKLLLGDGAAAGAPGRIDVAFVEGDWYRISVRDHEFAVDQPFDAGGGDHAPTPVELFVASLTACAGFYAGRYLARHGIPRDGLAVEAEFEMAEDRPARVGRVQLHVTVPPGLSPSRMKALRAVVDHCTVHNTLRMPPDVHITVA